jgi:hypothetical protein
VHKRDEIIAGIKKCAAKLGRAPSQAEFQRASNISWYQVYKHFRGMRQAVRAAGLEPGPRGSALDINALTLDWAGVVRKLGRLPSRAEYCEHGIHHAGTLHARIVWSQMSHKFVLLVKEFHLEREWADVVEIVVSKFPLLETSIQLGSIQQSALSIQPEQSNWQSANGNWQNQDRQQNLEPQRSRRSTEAGGLECLTLITSDNTDRQQGGMRLGKVVAAELAIEILMAAERSTQQSALGSTQQSALSIQPEQSNWQLGDRNWQLANSNWQEQNQNQNQNQNQKQDQDQKQDQNHEPQSTQEHIAEGLVHRHGAYAAGQTPCGRPVVYGEPLGLAAMAHAPTNELGVLFLFGIVAADLGFRVERLQAAFPDCETKREVAPGKWELVFIELEIYSRNFKLHRHNPKGCHAIVCWKHNWPDCPEWLEVIELSKVVKGK